MDGIGRKIPSPPWGSTHGQTTSGVTCNHSPWMTNMVERCRAWHDITALGLHARSDDVMRVMISPPLDSTQGRYSGRGITSPPLDSTHGRQRRAWHAIITFRKHTRSNDVGRAIPTSPLDSTNGRTTSSEASHHRPRTAHTVGNVGRGMTSPPLDSTHDQTTLGDARHHRLWTAHKLEQCRA